VRRASRNVRRALASFLLVLRDWPQTLSLTRFALESFDRPVRSMWYTLGDGNDGVGE
jgi:hypothetical protein